MRLDSLARVLTWATAVIVTATSSWIAIAIQQVWTLALPVIVSILPLFAPRHDGERVRWIAGIGIGAWMLVSLASVGLLYAPGFVLALSSAFAYPRAHVRKGTLPPAGG